VVRQARRVHGADAGGSVALPRVSDAGQSFVHTPQDAWVSVSKLVPQVVFTS
jgi:hypothetical protein